jgi:hypothetical protein
MPRVNRIGLVPVSQPGEAVRRYRLARLEDVSLATPPADVTTPHRNGNSAEWPEGVRHGVEPQGQHFGPRSVP